MAVCMGDLGAAGRTALTLAMRDSGEVMSWDLDGPVVDKHPPAGRRLRLADPGPGAGRMRRLCADDLGRGLGHTGGTLDKLEAIPGLSTAVPHEVLPKLVQRPAA